MKEYYRKWKLEANDFETQERKIISEQIEKVIILEIIKNNRKFKIINRRK